MLRSWWRTSSSSTRFLGFIFSLALVSGILFISFLRPSSNWNSIPSYSTGFVPADENGGGFEPDLRRGAVVVGGESAAAVAVDYVAAAPPLVVEVREAQAAEAPAPVVREEKNKQEDLLNNNTLAEQSTPKIIKTLSKLQVLEAKLQQARSAIRSSLGRPEEPDPDYVPTGPMYWNPSSFHRSYLEMEKQFKVYVYEEGEHPIFHNGPCGSIYSIEGNFIYKLEVSPFRTKNPENAHVYFLPFSVVKIIRFILDRNGRDHWLPLKRTVKDYVDLVAGKYPYWNRSLGSDHFMLSCHDWGPELSKAVPELYKNSIRALCNANTSEGFKPHKDVSIPEINLPGRRTDGLIGGPSPSKRPILVFFAGGLHGPIRPILLQHWENKTDDEVQIHRYLPKGVSYPSMMRKSRYCVCPSGYEVASPRMVESLYTGCVPVLIKDHYVAPFSDVLNWKSFSVEVSVDDIPNLKDILTGISSKQYIRMQRRGVKVRRHFEVNSPPKRFDVFHMTLHSIWLRRLNVRLHGVEDS